MELNTPTVINNSLGEYLKIGALYKVYGIRISDNNVYCMIFFEQRHLIEVPYDLFEIVDNNVSPLWKIRIENNNITFWPELFYQDDFFEDFSDWEDIERKEFLKLIELFDK